jgi:hypothetical protein
VKIPLLIGSAVFGSKQAILHREQLFGCEPEIDMQETVQALKQEPSSDQQNHRKRYLRRDEKSAHALPLKRRHAGAAVLKGAIQVDSASAQGGQEGREYPDHK